MVIKSTDAICGNRFVAISRRVIWRRMTELSFVPIRPEHLAAIYQIECKAHAFPWSEQQIDNLNSRGARHHVLLKQAQVIGYVYAQQILDEVSLLNIAVSPAHQGQGYGRQLLTAFLNDCAQQAATTVWLEVRASNLQAYQLYLSAGFHEVDRRRNYYPAKQGREDALLMSCFLLS